MRARNLKPGFFKNEELVECEPLARLLFAGLWCCADREGKLEDRPKRLKIEILPCDECDVDELLNQLQRHRLIIRYAVDERKYIKLPGFLNHQKPHQNETASSIPEPTCDYGSKEERPRNEVETTKADTRPASSLNPSSLNDESLLKNPCSKKDFERSFEEQFWPNYPKKDAKKKAKEIWVKKIQPSQELVGVIVSALKRQRASPTWTKDGGQYIPLPTTYLNNERWNDQGAEVSSISQKYGSKGMKNADAIASWLEKSNAE